MRNTVLLIVTALLLGTLSAAQAANSCSAKSGESTTALLELYTSEGCSSCPPADQWLATLPGRGWVPQRVVPLALHVDYWNDLGWEDPYSQKKFTLRQYRSASLAGARTVYTPQFILNGDDLPQWRNLADTAIRRVNTGPARANVTLTLSRGTNQLDVTADGQVKNDGDHPEMYIALYENNLVTHIDAGENQGLTLRHDFVVRRLIGPVPLEKGAAHFTQRMTLDREWKENDLGVAAFVQNRDDGKVLQALALPLCR
jgi:hypothetical protein